MKVDQSLEVGTLVVFSKNGSNGFYGLILENSCENLKVFDFDRKITQSLPINNLCLPLPFEGLTLMCKNKWWEGLTFVFKDPELYDGKRREIVYGIVNENKSIALYYKCNNAIMATTLEKISITGVSQN